MRLFNARQAIKDTGKLKTKLACTSGQNRSSAEAAARALMAGTVPSERIPPARAQQLSVPPQATTKLSISVADALRVPSRDWRQSQVGRRGAGVGLE